MLKAVARAGVLGAAALVVREAGRTSSLLKVVRESVDVDDVPVVDGIYGRQYDDGGNRLILVTAGDSLLSTRGAKEEENTAPVQLAKGLADKEQRPIRLINVARTGHMGSHLKGQIQDLRERLDGIKPDVVFVSMGGSDVRGGTPWKNAKIDYRDAVFDLTRMGAQVAWATVPPMNAPAPLAGTAVGVVMRRKSDAWSEKITQLLNGISKAGYGVMVVPFDKNMADFRDHPEWFSPDDPFHPGDMGQPVAASRVVPYLHEALHKVGNPHPQQSKFDPRGYPIQPT